MNLGPTEAIIILCICLSPIVIGGGIFLIVRLANRSKESKEVVNKEGE